MGREKYIAAAVGVGFLLSGCKTIPDHIYTPSEVQTLAAQLARKTVRIRGQITEVSSPVSHPVTDGFFSSGCSVSRSFELTDGSDKPNTSLPAIITSTYHGSCENLPKGFPFESLTGELVDLIGKVTTPDPNARWKIVYDASGYAFKKTPG